MIVCLCHAVDEAQIEDLVVGGIDSLCAIGRVCGAGTECGACLDQIQDIIDASSEPTMPAHCHLTVISESFAPSDR